MQQDGCASGAPDPRRARRRLSVGRSPRWSSDHPQHQPDPATAAEALILDDRTWFREQFAALDGLRAETPPDARAVRELWEPLAARLDLHAIAEEEIFYPQLLNQGEDPEAETLDAIADRNDIRDGVHDADRHPVGTAEWWDAVGRARKANDEHMAEEEREGLPTSGCMPPPACGSRWGRRLAEFLDTHRTTAGVDTTDKDPEGYVRAVEQELHPPTDDPVGADGSLRIGSLKGR